MINRRDFIKTSSLIGLSSTFHWASAKESSRTSFLTEKVSDHMLFARPQNGAQLDISPVGLAWLPCPNAKQYRVEIRNASNQLVYNKTIASDPVHLPDKVLPAGDYQWNIVALDECGTEVARRGRQTFSILQGAVHLPWIDAKILLNRVPKEHPRLLYPHHKLDSIRSTLSTTRKHSWAACRAAADKALNIGIPVYPSYHKTKDPVARRLEYKQYFKYLRPYINGALIDLSLAYLMSQEKTLRRCRQKNSVGNCDLAN